MKRALRCWFSALLVCFDEDCKALFTVSPTDAHLGHCECLRRTLIKLLKGLA